MSDSPFSTFNRFSTLRNEDRVFTTLRLRDARNLGVANGGHRYSDYLDDFSEFVFCIDGHESIDWNVIFESKKRSEIDKGSAIDIAKDANIPDHIVFELEACLEESKMLIPKNHTILKKIDPNLIILLHILGRHLSSFNCFFAAYLYPPIGSPLENEDSYSAFRRYLNFINDVAESILRIRKLEPEIQIPHSRILSKMSSLKKARAVFTTRDRIEHKNPAYADISLILSFIFSSSISIPEDYGVERLGKRINDIWSFRSSSAKMAKIIKENHSEDRISAVFEKFGVNDNSMELILSDMTTEELVLADKSWILSWTS